MKILVMTAILFMAASNALAQKAEIFQREGAAIRGYDPVAFFKEQKPVKGSIEYTTKWKDAAWQFSSQQNLDSFKVSPEKYAPQYGGYCAYGMADGHKAPTETDTWTVLDGKLYFNYNLKVKSSWDKDRPGYIEKANRNWEKIKLAE